MGEVQERYDSLKPLAAQIALLVPDGTLLHALIATLPNGCELAAQLPGSVVGSARLADAVAMAEAKGATQYGFCAKLMGAAEEDTL